MRHAPLLALVVVLAACGDRSESPDSAASAAAHPPGITVGSAGADARAAEIATRGFSESAPVASPTLPTGMPAPTPQALPLPGQEALAEPMLVRVGQATVQVDSLGAGVARVRDLARRAGGIVANTNLSAGRDERPSARIELRVPGDRFDELVGGLSTLGRVESVQVQVQDVGEEFTDVSARVANARRLEQRLLEVLGRNGGRLADILALERELARVREEIERYEGRLRYLRTRAAFSSLTVAVHEPLPIVASPPGRGPIAEAFREAWRNFVGLVAAVIASLGVLVPVGALGVGTWVLVRRWRRGGLTA